MTLFHNINLNELAKRVHSNSVANGFWDIQLSDEHCFAMTIGEISEAIEADRQVIRNTPMTFEKFVEVWRPILIQSGSACSDDILFCLWYKENVKGTVEEEFADAIIRILDLSGARDWDLEAYLNGISTLGTEKALESNKTFTELMFLAIKLLTLYDPPIDRSCYLIYFLKQLSEKRGIDIEKHIEMKIRFNEQRPHKHGKHY